MADTDQLREQLPEPIKARLQGFRIEGDVAIAMLDAGGLGAEERAALEAAARSAIEGLPGIEEARVAMVADRVRRRIVAIGSGKGGVGKSTLTANLAVALAKDGHKVGLVDADIYGPSQPTLLDNQDAKPETREKKLVPVPSPHGVPVLSMGHLASPGKAIAWRGPMAGNALAQLIDAQWDDTELLLVDLPPGTGDVQLSMLQRFKPVGAVIVSTPQDLALIDARRAADLFAQAEVPIIGVVENMAGYACPHCGEVSDPFGAGGAEAAAETMGAQFMGRIPLSMTIRAASDAGVPPASGTSDEAKAFAQIAGKLADWLAQEGR